MIKRAKIMRGMKKRKRILIISGTLAILAIIVAAFIWSYIPFHPIAEQWYLQSDGTTETDIHAIEMWKTFRKVKNKHKIIVAVIDTGVDTSNKEISHSIWTNSKEIAGNKIDDDHNGYVDDVNGWNFYNNDNNVSEYSDTADEIGHGTKVSGIICASQMNGGVMGIVDGRYVEIMVIKALGSSEDSYSFDSGKVGNVIKAIDYAEDNGAEICNLSFNTDKNDAGLEKKISESKRLFVVSAGNAESMRRNIDISPSYPASYDSDNVITVTNIKSNGRINTGANYGKNSVDIAAPGTDIYNIGDDGECSYGTGTSYAAPIVTGTAAALYVCDSNMTGTRCKKLLCDSASQERRISGRVNNGRVVDCENALRKCLIKKEEDDLKK